MRVLVEMQEGRMAAPLLDNGLAKFLVEGGAEVLVVTPAARVPECVERWSAKGIELRHIPLTVGQGRLESYERIVGRWLSEHGLRRTRRALWRAVAEPLAERRGHTEASLVDQWRPDVVVATHLSHRYGRCLIAAARRRRIPTVGNLVSWDNAYRPLSVRPDRITCWSERNRGELMSMCAYESDQIDVIGAPAFDAYFEPASRWTREELCGRLGLDPARPILLFATLGQMTLFMDETFTFEATMRAVRDGRIQGSPQVVLRLHPTSRAVFFERHLGQRDVVVSRYRGYIPWMAWAPWRDEIILAANLLRHADVCVSPGSTMTIESAIFDTPTVMPVMNAYQPDAYNSMIERNWLQAHFKPLLERGVLQIARTEDQLVTLVNQALADRTAFAPASRKIREALLGPLDGKATQRLAEVILAKRKPAGRSAAGTAGA